MADDLTLYNDAVTEALRWGRRPRKMTRTETITVEYLGAPIRVETTIQVRDRRALPGTHEEGLCEVCGRHERLWRPSMARDEEVRRLQLCLSCRSAAESRDRCPRPSSWGRFWRALTLHAFCREEIAEGGASRCLTCEGYCD